MLRRLAVLLFLGGFGVISVHANSIALSDTRFPAYRATKPSTQLRETRPILSLVWLRAATSASRGAPIGSTFVGVPVLPQQNSASEFWELQSRVPASLLRSVPAATPE